MKPKKIYYSISDVASLAKVKPYVLRYWETEFGQLKPKAMRGGRRAYRERDIRLVMMIKKLLYEDRFTIEGARKKLRTETGQQRLAFPSADREKFLAVRRELSELLDLLKRGRAAAERGSVNKG